MAEFLLTSRGSDFVVLVDDEDLDAVLAKGPWQIRKASKDRTMYVVRRGAILHRWLLDAPKGTYVDHINGNGLDNRRCNLRLCTANQNQYNVGIQVRNISGFKGVGWFSPTKMWRARLQVDGKRIHLGWFRTAEAARDAYLKAVHVHHGEFARLDWDK